MYRLFLLLALAGCASSPYAELGVGYQYYGNYENNPSVHFEAGLEWDGGYSCALNHWSHLRNGWPFNDRFETHKDELICKKRWGGK
jgi:hypothetical protein